MVKHEKYILNSAQRGLPAAGWAERALLMENNIGAESWEPHRAGNSNKGWSGDGLKEYGNASLFSLITSRRAVISSTIPICFTYLLKLARESILNTAGHSRCYGIVFCAVFSKHLKSQGWWPHSVVILTHASHGNVLCFWKACLPPKSRRWTGGKELESTVPVKHALKLTQQ